METIGLDLHKRESQLCMVDEHGARSERRIHTTRERLAAVLGDRPPARVLLESGTESEWVARYLESLGHTVIVADPNFAPMYATRSRRVKTDKRDARTLADACRLGAYRPAHRLSDTQRHVRAELAVRDVLVRTRTRYIALAKALIRRDGHRIPGSDAEHAADHMLALAPEPTLRAELAPLVAMWHTLGEQIRAADRRLATVVAADPIVRRLATVPGIGPVTATAYVATIDEVQRFPTAHHVEAYLGLVPSERSSGEKQQRGHITKAGNVRLRWLLVEAGWRMLLSRRAETVHLRTWALRIALRRGKKIAVVALARRLAGILYAMWRDGTDYAGPPPKQTRAPEE